MRLDDYRAFTAELVANLEDDARVLGLVAAGSMAERDYDPDEWSDHDFLVIAAPGAQEELRAELSWLPRAERVAMAFHETEHGMKAVYDDAHMLEFAVFDLEEIGLAGLNRTRVLFDRGDVEQRVEESKQWRTQRDDEFLFGMTVTAALVAAGRARRGEVLSGAYFLIWAIRHLAALIPRVVPSANASILDEFDSFRRFERVFPRLGAELAELARRPPEEGAAAVLDVTARELRATRPELAWEGFDAVSRHLHQGRLVP